jgi:hypothetical protein
MFHFDLEQFDHFETRTRRAGNSDDGMGVRRMYFFDAPRRHFKPFRRLPVACHDDPVRKV